MQVYSLRLGGMTASENLNLVSFLRSLLVQTLYRTFASQLLNCLVKVGKVLSYFLLGQTNREGVGGTLYF